MKKTLATKVSILNRRASFEYTLLDKYTAGLKLVGTEIKSLRVSGGNVQDGYCAFNSDGLWLYNTNIPTYDQSGKESHEPNRARKLLLKKSELKKLEIKLKDQGLTIVPVKLFTDERGIAKLEIALAKGKKLYDKRESIKKKDNERESAREN